LVPKKTKYYQYEIPNKPITPVFDATGKKFYMLADGDEQPARSTMTPVIHYGN
jgi:hypothetical protein